MSSNSSESRGECVACPRCGGQGFQVLPTGPDTEYGTLAPNALVVRCSACDRKYLLRWEGQVRLLVADPARRQTLPAVQVGEVLRLEDDFDAVDAGMYAVVSTGRTVTLRRVGKDEDGNLCTTRRTVPVKAADIERFTRTDRSILPLPER